MPYPSLTWAHGRLLHIIMMVVPNPNCKFEQAWNTGHLGAPNLGEEVGEPEGVTWRLTRTV